MRSTRTFPHHAGSNDVVLSIETGLLLDGDRLCFFGSGNLSAAAVRFVHILDAPSWSCVLALISVTVSTAGKYGEAPARCGLAAPLKYGEVFNRDERRSEEDAAVLLMICKL